MTLSAANSPIAERRRRRKLVYPRLSILFDVKISFRVIKNSERVWRMANRPTESNQFPPRIVQRN